MNYHKVNTLCTNPLSKKQNTVHMSEILFLFLLTTIPSSSKITTIIILNTSFWLFLKKCFGVIPCISVPCFLLTNIVSVRFTQAVERRLVRSHKGLRNPAKNKKKKIFFFFQREKNPLEGFNRGVTCHDVCTRSFTWLLP